MTKTLAKTEAQPTDLVSLIWAAARDKDVDVTKMQVFMDMKVKVDAILHRQAFNKAMSKAQSAMQVIAANADNPQTQSKYADLAAFDRLLRPIYTEHGMDVHFDTGDVVEGYVNLICIISHEDGGERRSSLPIPVITVGPKGNAVMTETHATMSAVTYGKRTLLGMMFNIATSKDDDGNAAGSEPLNSDELNDLLEICEEKDLSDAQMLKFCEIHKVTAFAEIHRTKYRQAKQALQAYQGEEA